MTPWLLLLLSAAGALGVFALRGREPWPGRAAVAGALLTLAAAVWAVAMPAPAAWPWGPRLLLELAAEGFGRVMAVLVPAIATPVIAYAAAHEPAAGRARLLALLLVFTGAMELLVLAADLVTLLVGWELVGACSWALIAHEWRDPARPRSAGYAFLTTRFGDLGLYLAAAAAFSSAGSFAFADLARVRGPALDVVAAGILLAAVAKSAQVPFSPWLFAAMAGPTSASALLHSAAMVAAGAYALIRLAPVLEPTGWFSPLVIAIGLVTTFAGGAVALLQRDFKRALAGSTSSQYGLMFLAVGAGSTAAAGTHLVAHAAFKALLFLGSGIAIQTAGTGDLGRLRLGRALPRVAAAFAVGALALAAVPPLGGAYSKELIVSAASHWAPWLGIVVLVSGALTALYAARMHLLAYGPDGPEAASIPTGAERVSVSALALASLALGVLWLPETADLLRHVAGTGLPEGSARELALSLALISTAGVTGILLFRRGILTTLGLPHGTQNAIADWLGLPTLARAGVARPALALAAALASFDARVVDAGIRLAAAAGRKLAGLFASFGELAFDRVVQRTAQTFGTLARSSGAADDRVLDVAVERTAAGAGWAGSMIRRLQTGLSHQYFLFLALGVLGAVALALLGR